jgi:hypothetical protein
MIWTDFFDNNNKREELLELFKDPHTLSRGDPLPAGRTNRVAMSAPYWPSLKLTSTNMTISTGSPFSVGGV